MNGNIKHKTCDNKREGDFAGKKASAAVSTAIFLVCFSCTVGIGPANMNLKNARVLLLAYDKEAVFSANS